MADAMREVMLTIGSEIFNGTWSVSMTNRTETWILECKRSEWSAPFYGHIMEEKEIRELIDFLQNTLREKKENEQSKLE